MCWNSKVSLNTFLFSLFGILFAYCNNVIGIFELLYFLSFNSMQLVEYFTWENLNDKKINTLLSKIAAFLIFIQIPLFIQSVYTGPYKSGIIGFYILIYLLCISQYKVDYSMTKAPNGHLAWNWLNFPTWLIILWLSFIFGTLFYEKRYISFILYFIIISAIYYTYYKSKTWGSLWCWISNILALKLILQVFYKDICQI